MRGATLHGILVLSILLLAFGIHNAVSTEPQALPEELPEEQQLNTVEQSRSLEDVDGFSVDHLSQSDQTFFESKNASFWRAQDQETLKQVLLIHRHGDRTPVEFPSKDNLANEPFWKVHGLSQLTNRGKARVHMLGKIIRQRYDQFFGGSVNKNMRKSRSSGALRCIESAQVFLASLLSLDTNQSPDADALAWGGPSNTLASLWQPASVSTLSAKYDGMMNEGAECKNIEAEIRGIDRSNKFKELMREFKNVTEVLERELDFKVEHFYHWFWGSSMIEVERSYFEKKMKPEVLEIYDDLQTAGNRALVLFQSKFKVRRAKAGLLINDMIGNMKGFRNVYLSGEESPFVKKFVHYSAHDTNLLFLLGMFGHIDNFPFRPDYAASIIIELHQDDDEWFIKLFYMPRVPSEPIELKITNCVKGHPSGRCTLDKFNSVMYKYRVDGWMGWMKDCGNSIDEINPYKQNL